MNDTQPSSLDKRTNEKILAEAVTLEKEINKKSQDAGRSLLGLLCTGTWSLTADILGYFIDLPHSPQNVDVDYFHIGMYSISVLCAVSAIAFFRDWRTKERSYRDCFQRRNNDLLKKLKKHRMEQEKIYTQAITQVRDSTRFLGSLQEYEHWKGYPCEILNQGMRLDNISSLPRKEVISLQQRGIEAIVNYTATTYVGYYGTVFKEESGLPIARKQED